mmetsp:Transcript_66809/g.124825  ORF Transcript_66809/g.124825 Transcript_66809/m.124825 type:complete len:146 (+) Transcript_66809:74-511(+)
MATSAFFNALPSSFKSMLPAPSNNSGAGKKSMMARIASKVSSNSSGTSGSSERSVSQPPSPRLPSPTPRTRREQKQVQVAGTEVPEDLYRDLLKAGENARRRGQHRLVVVQDAMSSCSSDESDEQPKLHLLLSRPEPIRKKPVHL